MPTAEFSVLLADHDLDSRRIFAIIAEFCQLESVIVENAADAFRYLADHQPDVIILDLQLPDTDGYRTYRTIREQGLADASAIIATTSYYTRDTANEVAARGFDGYIPEPFEPNTLMTSLRAAVANRQVVLENGNDSHE